MENIKIIQWKLNNDLSLSGNGIFHNPSPLKTVTRTLVRVLIPYLAKDSII